MSLSPSHDHNHDHNHSHIPNDKKILAICFVIISGFMMVEFICGQAFNSLALMADAGHMANDSLSLFLALIALFLREKPQKILALINGLSLVFVAIWIVIEAVERFYNPLIINSLAMISVAVLGLLVNVFTAKLMLNASHDNLNIKSAYLHILADMAGSAVAIIAGLSAWAFGVVWVDTLASVLLAVLVLKSGASVSLLAWQNLRAK